MIWISRDLDLLVPPADLAAGFADDLGWAGKRYRKLTPAMFRRLREDRGVKVAHPGRFAKLVAAILKRGLEETFFDKGEFAIHYE